MKIIIIVLIVLISPLVAAGFFWSIGFANQEFVPVQCSLSGHTWSEKQECSDFSCTFTHECTN